MPLAELFPPTLFRSLANDLIAIRLATDALVRTKSRGNKRLGTKETKGHLDPSGLD